MEQKSNSFLETEKIGKLMKKYAVPCIISLLVAALYNIVDQIFIANTSYLGSYGNAANTVVYPLTVLSLAVAVMIGDGCCAFVSISLGANKKEDAHRSIGTAVILCIICSIVITAVYLIFMDLILTLFGGRVNEETFYHAKEYFFWISLGIPFYMFGQAMNPIIRSDGSPKFAMAATVSVGNDGSSCSHSHRTDFDSRSVNLVSLPYESDPAGQKQLPVIRKTDERLSASGHHQLSVTGFSGGIHGSSSECMYKIRGNA